MTEILLVDKSMYLYVIHVIKNDILKNIDKVNTSQRMTNIFY